MANPKPAKRQASTTHQTAQLRVYLPNDLAEEIARLPKGQRAKTLGRWLMFGMETERQFETVMSGDPRS